MDRMASCTTPTFSKIDVTLSDTQPAMLETCQASGSAIATVPTLTEPRIHSQTAQRAGAHHHAGVGWCSVRMKVVINRNWARTHRYARP